MRFMKFGLQPVNDSCRLIHSLVTSTGIGFVHLPGSFFLQRPWNETKKVPYLTKLGNNQWIVSISHLASELGTKNTGVRGLWTGLF